MKSMLHKLYSKYMLLPVQLRASIWFLICSCLQKGILIVTTPVFTRLMSTTEYGNYSTFNSWLNIVTVFVSLNLFYGVYTQGLVKFEDERKTFTSSLQGLTLTLIVVWAVIYFAAYEFWNQLFSLTTVQMIAMFVIIWGTAVFSFWAAEQRVEYNYKNLVVVTLIVALIRPTTEILFVLNAKDKVTARVVAIALVELIAYIGLFAAQMYRGKRYYVKKFWIYAFCFNIPLIPHYLSQTVLNSSDRIMIKAMVGEDSAGIYSLAYSISLLIMLLNTALSQTISPWIYQKIKKKKVEDISKVAYSSLIIIAFGNLVLIAFAPEVVAIFAPADYCEAIWIIPPVAMSVYFMFAYDLFAKFEFYFEKTKWITLATVLGAGINVFLNYIFIERFGYCAAGYTTLLCYLLYALFHYLFMRKVCREYLDGQYPYKTKILLVITVGFVGTGFLFLALYKNMIVRYLLIGTLFVLIIINRKIIVGMVRKLIGLKHTGI